MKQERLCTYDDLASPSATRFEIVDSTDVTHRIALIRIEDSLYAIGDTCSHADVSLSEGTVWEDECEIECWKHGSLFSLRTGKPTTLPATQPVAVYNIVRSGTDVMIELP